MALSKPEKEVPDLCLLAIFSQMNLADRINAHHVCPHWYHRVREANQDVNTLTIATGLDWSLGQTEKYIDHSGGRGPLYDRHPHPTVRLVASSPTAPVRPPLTEWNCLLYPRVSERRPLKLVVIKPIISALPAINELTFVGATLGALVSLVKMLRAASWKVKLTGLKAVVSSSSTSSSDQSADTDKDAVGRLFNAISNLRALQNLTLKGIPLYYYELPFLARLRKFSLLLEEPLSFEGLISLQSSLRQFAGQNGHLQVALSPAAGSHNGGYQLLTRLRSDQSLCGAFTCVCGSPIALFSADDLPSLRLTDFQHLRKLKLNAYFEAEEMFNIGQLFHGLAELPELAELTLGLSWIEIPSDQPPLPPNQLPTDVLPALRKLSLAVYFSGHNQLQWLNLPVTVPNVEKINLKIWGCTLCDFSQQKRPEQNAAADVRECFRANLRALRASFASHQVACYQLNQVVPAEELLPENA